MAYTKNNWHTGDIVTAAKLNNMEDGIAGVEAEVSSVVANPTLAGTEDDLTGLQVGDTKYKVGGGLPSYTNDDIGKSLKLVDSGGPTETVVTIEEQTVSVQEKTGRVGIEIVDGYLWQVGDAVHLTLNGTLYECVVAENLAVDVYTVALGIKATTDVGDVGIDFIAKRLYYGGNATFTVSATIDAQIPSAAPAWVSGGSSGGGVLVVHAEVNAAGTAVDLDKTWREIADADLAVISSSMHDPDGTAKFFVYQTVCESEGVYSVSVFSIAAGSIAVMHFYTNTENGYPSFIIPPNP